MRVAQMFVEQMHIHYLYVEEMHIEQMCVEEMHGAQLHVERVRVPEMLPKPGISVCDQAPRWGLGLPSRLPGANWSFYLSIALLPPP